MSRRRKNRKKVEISVKSIFIFLVIIIIVIVVICKIKNKPQSAENITQTVENNYIEISDNYRLNISSKLKENKKVKDLDVENIGIFYKNERSTVSVKVQNNTNATSERTGIKINLLNNQGQVLKVLFGYIDSIDPGEEIVFDIIDKADLSNVFDYEIFEQ